MNRQITEDTEGSKLFRIILQMVDRYHICLSKLIACIILSGPYLNLWILGDNGMSLKVPQL
jgi:hypothetical protein